MVGMVGVAFNKNFDGGKGILKPRWAHDRVVLRSTGLLGIFCLTCRLICFPKLKTNMKPQIIWNILKDETKLK